MSGSTSKKKKNALKGKGGLITGVAVVVLGAWLAADMIWGPKPREEGVQPFVGEYIHVKAADVKRVELKRASGSLVLTRSGDVWSFEAPGHYRANSQSVKAWLEGVLDNASISHPAEGPASADVAQYGLDKPTVEAVFTTGNGQTHTLQLGKEFPGVASAGYYAREVKDNKLFLLGTTQVADLKDKKVDELRDKRLVSVTDEKEIRKVVLKRGSGVVEVERSGSDKWQIKQPLNAPADKLNVEENLVRELKSAEASSFVVDPKPDPAKYGLVQPRLTVEATDKKGLHTVTFGNETKDNKIYALVQGETEVALVPKSVYDNLNKNVGDLRGKELITLQSDRVSYVELKNAHGLFRLEKTGKDAWMLSDGTDPQKRKAKGEKVQQIITDLTGAAYKYVEENPADLGKYGLTAPEITVTLNQGQGSSQIFRLGSKSKDGFYAKGPSSPVYEVQAYVRDDLNVQRAALEDTGTPPAPPKK